MSLETARIKYWEFKLESWELYRRVKPNAVHQAVVALEKANRLAMVVTQNVDGLHSIAGTSPERLVELHGTDRMVECQSCGARDAPDAHFESFRQTSKPPLCGCGGYLKPATISFGQNLREGDLDRAAAAAKKADLVIALGSTLSVFPAASIPLIAADSGVPYIIINQGATDHDRHPSIALRLEGNVVEMFPSATEKALKVSCLGSMPFGKSM